MCIKSAFFTNDPLSPKTGSLVCRLCADKVQTLHTLSRLGADFVVKSVHLANSGMDLIQLSVTAWLPPGKRPKKTWGDTVTKQRS